MTFRGESPRNVVNSDVTDTPRMWENNSLPPAKKGVTDDVRENPLAEVNIGSTF